MAQFIHLLLLLGMCHVAAMYVYERQVWLLEGSSATFPFPKGKSRTIKYCGRGGSRCECVLGFCKSNNASLPGVTVTDSNLTITNFTLENDHINLCYDSSPSHQCVHLNVSIGRSESHFLTLEKGQPKHNKMTEADCRRLCTEDPTCQYFTSDTDKKNCYLMTSRDDMLIQLHSHAVSGYPARDDCAPVNPTSVPPGLTPPQPSAPVNPTSVPPGLTPPQPTDEEEEEEEAPVKPTSVPPDLTPPQPTDEVEEEEAPENPTSAPPGLTPPQPSDEEEEKEAPVNPTSVSPGPTPPQPSDEEEEEEEVPKCQQMVFWS